MATVASTPARALVAPPLIAAVLAAGPVAAVLAIASSIVVAGSGPDVPGWAPAAALAALVAGVPHGAVDHLALARSPSGRRRLVLAAGYLALAATAATAVVLAPVPAFVAVLAMSVWHFGTGDVALADELAGSPPRRPGTRMLQVLAAGSVPVLLPLTSPAATATLLALEPRLVAVTAPGVLVGVRTAVLVLAAGAVVVLLRERRLAQAGELVLLVALALTVTPLLAFAVYFSAWHAARHTLRLALDDGSRLDTARLRAVLRDGLPSLVVTLAVVAAALASGAATSSHVLWLALAAVWGLTVPHMVVVGAFDRRRRAARVSPARPTPAAART